MVTDPKCKISFVIVNYNAFDFSISCISSIRENFGQPLDYEIVMVDNSPMLTDVERLRQYAITENITELKVFRVENRGFGHANNFGIQQAKGDIIFILNNDAELLKFMPIDTITDLLNVPQNGIIAPKVIYPDGRLQPNASTFLNPFSSILRFLRVGQLLYNNKFLSWLIRNLFSKRSKVASSYFNREQNSLEAKYVDWASGCGLLFKKSVFDEIGGFDENFFMYFEDEELCYRFYKKNKNVYYFPDLLIAHHVGASSKLINEKIEVEKIKSELYFYSKHIPEYQLKLRRIYMVISFLLSPFSNRFKVISRALRKGLV
jgi:GT2 family glycosyltransferase